MSENTLIRVDKNGTEYHEGMVKCPKCGGLGKISCYDYIDGGICYNCDGSGKTHQKWKIYTPEHEAKLDKKRKLAQEKRSERLNAKYEKEQRDRVERAARWEAQKLGELAKLKYIGSVGDKIEIEVTLLRVFIFESVLYGTSYLHKMKDNEGNILIWKTSSRMGKMEDDCFTPVQEDETVTIKATVKLHQLYEQEKQTHVIRVKIK